ncbi:MAG: hypothetical protein ACOH2V_00315 [Candidatus Saccharimonadaceae bacterium]
MRDFSIEIPRELIENSKVHNAAVTLESSKRNIVDKLQIPSDTYDKLATLVLGIMGRESNYGEPGFRGALGILGDEVNARVFDKNVSAGPFQLRKSSVPKDLLKQLTGNTEIKYNDLVNSSTSSQYALLTLYDIYKNIAPRYKTKYPNLSLEEITLAYYANPQGVINPDKAELRIPYAKTVLDNASKFKLNYNVDKMQIGGILNGVKLNNGLIIPNMYGNVKESPNRYMLRLYNSSRIKGIIGSYVDPQDVEMYQENKSMLLDWNNLEKENPNTFDNDYKKVINNLIRFYEKDHKDPTKVILGTGLKTTGDSKGVYGSTRPSEPFINVFPFQHTDRKDVSVPSTYVHEMSHQIFPSTLKNSLQSNKKTYFKETSKDEYSTISDSRMNYLADPTEKLARVNELRYNLDKLKIYDATKEDFTEDHYDAMIKSTDPKIQKLIFDLNQGSLEKTGNMVKPIPKEKRKENIIRLMNEVAINDNKSSESNGNFTRINKAYQGGGITKKKIPELDSYNTPIIAVQDETKRSPAADLIERMINLQAAKNKPTIGPDTKPVITESPSKASTIVTDVGTNILEGIKTFGGSVLANAGKDVYGEEIAKKVEKYSFGMLPYTRPEQYEANRNGNWQNRINSAADAASSVALGEVIGNTLPIVSKGVSNYVTPRLRNLAYRADNYILASLDKLIKPRINTPILNESNSIKSTANNLFG